MPNRLTRRAAEPRLYAAMHALAETACAWERCRQEEEELRGIRRALPCALERDPDAERQPYGVPPCWKRRKEAPGGHVPLLEPAAWCDGCRERQAVHEQLRRKSQERAAYERSLQRRARALEALRARIL